MPEPLVSVIMVTADHHAPYIRESVDSVLGQSFKEWEVIIIDDGPTGAVAEQVSRYTDPRIHYVRQDHVGVKQLGASYNRALSLAKSHFIAILEGDDYWPANKLEAQVPAFEQSDAVLSYGIVEHVNANGQLLHDRAPSFAVEKEKGALENQPVGRTAIAMARHWQYVSPASIVIRREALEGIGGFLQPSYYAAVDFPTVLKLATLGPFHYLPLVMGFSRRHQASVTAGVVPGRTYLMGMFRCWLEIMQASDLQLSRQDMVPVVAYWRAYFSKYYRMLGRVFLDQGEGKKARACFRASLEGSVGLQNVMAMGGILFSYLPEASYFLESFYKLLGRESADKNVFSEYAKEAIEIISTIEAWAGGIELLCDGKEKRANQAGVF